MVGLGNGREEITVCHSFGIILYLESETPFELPTKEYKYSER
jgi:hypothetical protein